MLRPVGLHAKWSCSFLRLLFYRVYHVNYYFNSNNSRRARETAEKNANCAVNRFMFIFNRRPKTEAFRISKCCREVASRRRLETCLGGHWDWKSARKRSWQVRQDTTRRYRILFICWSFHFMASNHLLVHFFCCIFDNEPTWIPLDDSHSIVFNSSCVTHIAVPIFLNWTVFKLPFKQQTEQINYWALS